MCICLFSTMSKKIIKIVQKIIFGFAVSSSIILAFVFITHGSIDNFKKNQISLILSQNSYQIETETCSFNVQLNPFVSANAINIFNKNIEMSLLKKIPLSYIKNYTIEFGPSKNMNCTPLKTGSMTKYLKQGDVYAVLDSQGSFCGKVGVFLEQSVVLSKEVPLIGNFDTSKLNCLLSLSSSELKANGIVEVKKIE